MKWTPLSFRFDFYLSSRLQHNLALAFDAAVWTVPAPKTRNSSFLRFLEWHSLSRVPDSQEWRLFWEKKSLELKWIGTLRYHHPSLQESLFLTGNFHKVLWATSAFYPWHGRGEKSLPIFFSYINENSLLENCLSRFSIFIYLFIYLLTYFCELSETYHKTHLYRFHSDSVFLMKTLRSA